MAHDISSPRISDYRWSYSSFIPGKPIVIIKPAPQVNTEMAVDRSVGCVVVAIYMTYTYYLRYTSFKGAVKIQYLGMAGLIIS